MDYNLNFADIALRYALMMIAGILFGLTQNYFFIALTLVFFLQGILAFCPLFYVLGINHAEPMEEANH